MYDKSKSKVAIEACDSYEMQKVYKTVKSCIDSLGGIEKFIQPRMTVALKPNLLLPQNPESSATTHPVVIAAVGRLIKEAGAHPIIIESPGGPYNKVILKNVYKTCGLFDICEKYGIELNYDTDVVKKTADCFGRKRSFSILKPLAQADFVINICKMKTHGMMVFTGAVKNMFGSIAGAEKATYHMNMPDYESFASNLIDICETAAPGLSIMDAVVAMEGKGPSGGESRHIGAVLVSCNPYALDMAAHDIIGLKKNQSYVMNQAVSRGIEVEYTSTLKEAKEFFCPDFDIPFKRGDLVYTGFLNSRLLSIFKSKPVVQKDICIGCGICMRSCPAKVIKMENGYPYFDYNECIRCYCCQELCPKHAIDIMDPFLIKMLKLGKNR